MRKFFYYLGAISLLLALCAGSLAVGVIELPLASLFSDSNNLTIFMASRVPRTLAIILAALALSFCGVVMQALLRNRFVEPATTGTPQGVAIGLLLAIIYLPNAPLYVHMALGAASGLFSLIVFLQISKRLDKLNSIMLPLVGLIYGGILGALVVLIAFENNMLQMIMVWLNGEFSAVVQGKYEILWLSLIGVIALYILADRLSIVGIGNGIATALGINERKVIYLALILIALTTSLVIVSIGMIAFLGLVVPNIVRLYMGDNLRKSLWWCAWLASVLLLSCDILGRLLIFPFELPISLVFGILGAIIFIIILFKPHRYA